MYKTTSSLIAVMLVLSLASCGSSGLFKKKTPAPGVRTTSSQPQLETGREKASGVKGKFWDLFKNSDNPNVTVGVNKYIWNAAMDILSFMPIENADPFSGVISYGWGSPAGSGRQYRATVYIQDPALDARSLRVALIGRGGPASKDTVRQIEDAILTRARQMRLADSKL